MSELITNANQMLMRRIVCEAEAIEQSFPGRFRLVITPQGLPAWTGDAPIEGQDVPIEVIYPSDYPASPPIITTKFVPPMNCPHVLERGEDRTRICWIGGNPRSPRRRWQPNRHTAATAIRSAQRWFLAYLVWKSIRIWPIADAFELDETGD